MIRRLVTILTAAPLSVLDLRSNMSHKYEMPR